MATEPTYELGLKLVSFLPNELRRLDREEGKQFLERYLKGPQIVWDQTIQIAKSLTVLMDVELCPDKLLRYLKWIVGWTSEPQLERITDGLSFDELRRLISVSAEMWRDKGPEDTILNVLRVVAGGDRARIWNYFDFRWVLDETGIGEEHDGRDPWVINLPSVTVSQPLIDSGVNSSSGDSEVVTVSGAGETFAASIARGYLFRLLSGTWNGLTASVLVRDSSTQITLEADAEIPAGGWSNEAWEIVDPAYEPDDAYRSNLRIVDSGLLDRQLVKQLLNLMRATGERWEITYLLFLDEFDVDGDDTQWAPLASGNVPVAGGLMQLLDDSLQEEAIANTPGAISWSEYVAGARIRGTISSGAAGYGIFFYWTDPDNFYAAALAPDADLLILTKNVAGVISVVATFPLTSFPILEGVFYLLRATVVPENGTNRITVSIDGSQLISTTDGDLTEGTVAVYHTADATVECSEVEVFGLPADTDSVEINEAP